MKRPVGKKKYSVYVIRHLGEVLYVGYTGDLTTREKVHNRLLRGLKDKKQLYVHLRSIGVLNVKLEVLKSFDKKIDAIYYEMWIILCYYFSDKWTLKQNIPRVSDRGGSRV